ncbi:transglycosylase SLT domain-containing protein [Campylobacter ureolyticus]|uniref:transglycosylase SLT domain-containing protein n=1 Tax=Campylobacter ureolyticus TaxID=827 RepID=UPI0022B2B113|nr:transglycosylase SLT domain-containing protein [Campylobacter ureolyticus]MCZ6116996.1 transglycosylase SLT domain-containing protein [Campylobacter ureolyticus]MCZ6166528.1 transglycosylase SLT domain-containing protein [Campylobacter ureolyticus]
MKILFFIFFSINLLFSYSYEEILYAIKDVSYKEGIANKVLYTIVKIESDLNPYAISFLTNKQNAIYFKSLETKNIRVKASPYSLNKSKWVVSINPSNESYAIEISKLLLKNGFNIDVGLGQLNSQNFSLNEIEYIFNPNYNLTKCAKILRKCFNAKNKDMQQTIECYNYGMRHRGSNPYYKRFYKHFMKEFGQS